MIPNTLDEWILDIVNELIEKKSNESDRHDFKRNFPDAENLTKTCCAFANSKGGFVILGVGQENSSFEIAGIQNNRELSHTFGQKIRANPTIYFSLPKIIEIPETENIIAIFEIPISPERPHIPDIAPEKRIFQKRTNKGNDFMSYDEIRFSFQDFQERREKIKLLYIELISNLDRLNLMVVHESRRGNEAPFVTLDDMILNGLLVELYSSISHNEILVKNLFQIRTQINFMNNMSKIFFSKMAFPATAFPINQTEIIQKHNIFIHSQIESLGPILENTIHILGTEFDFKNPFTS